MQAFAQCAVARSRSQANDQASGIAMMDARPWANAQANKGRGGGFEKVSNYEDSDTTLLFLNIDNIHVMRDSANQMCELLRSICRPLRPRTLICVSI